MSYHSSINSVMFNPFPYQVNDNKSNYTSWFSRNKAPQTNPLVDEIILNYFLGIYKLYDIYLISSFNIS